MKLVTPTLVVEDVDGFKNDALQRKSFGEALSNLVTRTSDELVISLDGKWGEGKTTFVKMWQGLLKEKGVPSIYIDAFQNDYTEDAFISIASAITAYVGQHAIQAEKSSEFSDKAKKVGIRLLSWSAKIGIKTATLGIIKESDIEALSEIGDDIATDTSETVATLVQDRLSTHSKENEIIQSFRESLSGVPETITDNKSGRLVVIIDELDRCRPSFAVEVLEKIKHLFSVKNVVFVLVMHKEQLEEAIRCVYGSNIDAHTYLQKFINIEATIPKRVTDRHSNDLDAYIARLLHLHELETWGDNRLIQDCLSSLGRHFNLSLRQLEKVFTNLAIIYSTSAKNQLRLVPIITFISTVKVVKPSVFSKILLGRISYTELISETELQFINNESNERNLIRIMDWVRFSILTDAEYKAINETDNITRLSQSLWEYSVDRERLLPMFCEKLNMFTVN
ncbi:energy-coupling factor transporter ATP-binding protein EcfA2 [Aeromonas sp. BIGb0405]|uniref:KAP family P-loop NTPase fold protein n=1 Tax=Aeromonas sp. BIGb0405 TaxID=2940592 RepID=UPI002169FF22|nr:KAP family NTPase [Aeromonas sp. BIGb0405]MCS3455270.1 energy-coupling factor transporter ATP-binding protein EcfA2 [Aeromonas sp. BIGb0405]